MPFSPLNSINSLTQNLSQATDMFRELYNRTITEVFKDDNGVQRVLLGKGANGFYGLKVSKPGYDVYDATDAQLIFNSAQNILKIASSGTTTVALPTLSNSSVGVKNITSRTTVAHGLGYRPIVIAYRGSSSQEPLPYTTQMAAVLGVTVGYTRTIEIFVDDTNVYFDATTTCYNWAASANNAPADTDTVKYYLLQETAN